MLVKELFEFARVHCANDYIMAVETRTSEQTLNYIKTKNLRIDNIIMKPVTNQFRFMFLPCKANEQKTEVFNVNKPSTELLRALWDLESHEYQVALSSYIMQSHLKHEYEVMPDPEKIWISSIILGAKE